LMRAIKSTFLGCALHHRGSYIIEPWSLGETECQFLIS
jgi:hypothetical protein